MTPKEIGIMLAAWAQEYDQHPPPVVPATRTDWLPFEAGLLRQMEPMHAYYGNGWALCSYWETHVERDAFMLVAACVPENIRKKEPKLGELEWICIRPMSPIRDPLGRCGYMGAKWAAGPE